ncbi:MAG: hypothetical protein ACOX9R_11460 [Armatimonadota bacterium]|jgi:outer membrane protein assembly factor BamB
MRILPTAAVLIGLICASAPAQEYEFENLGIPCIETGHELSFTTTHPDGYEIAWARHETPDFMGLLGVRLDTGDHFTVDLSQWGPSQVRAVPGPDGRLVYAYCGRPDAHFVRYDPATEEITDLGVPAENAHYFSSAAVAPDGRMYVGTFPRAALVWLDMHTGEMGTTGKITDAVENRYIFPTVEVSDDGIVYCTVGLHHQELVSYDPQTGETTQILPPELTALTHSPRAWKAADGHVYGRSGDTRYRCLPTGIEAMAETPPALDVRPRSGDWIVGNIDDSGQIRMTHGESGETRLLATQYRGRPIRIYAVGDEWEGRIWGGTMFPARAFSFDPETGEMSDHGRQTGGRIQIYDLIGTPNGLLLSSYTGAHINLWNPLAGEGEEPNHSLTGGNTIDQERPLQWTQGPDGQYYLGTRPIKGHVGGGLCRVTLDPLEATWWKDPVGPQSVMGVVAIDETNQLLGATSNYGGSSSIPQEDVGYVFLWDCEQERVVCKDMPVEGAVSYSAPVRARTGIVYGIAYTAERVRIMFAWDPIERRLVGTGELPGQSLPFPTLHGEPVGPDGLIIGLADDTVYAIDPADHSVNVLARHASISRAHGFFVTDAGVLYYGSGAELWRCDLLP